MQTSFESSSVNHTLYAVLEEHCQT